MIFLKLFWMFIKIGIFTFGGGYSMIALIQNEVVEKDDGSGIYRHPGYQPDDTGTRVHQHR